MQTEKLSLFAKIRLGILTTCILGAMGGACVISADPWIIDRAGDAYALALVSDPSKPTTKYALEGYKDTCSLEVWEYPSQYNSINEWKAAEPENAKPTHIEKANHPEVCDKNFNPDNPAVPFSGKEYGYDFGLRPEQHVVESAA
jgi:hypothetical protein